MAARAHAQNVPIIRAAGIGSSATTIIPVGDRPFTAFVADGRKIFINTGALMEASPPNAIIHVLYNAARRDEDSPEAREYLSMTCHRKGDEAKAQLAAAEGFFVAGKYVEARTRATRAKAKFEEGSQGWLRADDIAAYRPPGAREE